MTILSSNFTDRLRNSNTSFFCISRPRYLTACNHTHVYSYSSPPLEQWSQFSTILISSFSSH
ncbi:hypothetical protein K435DRAFT_301085 [Dendrothele bispora CBS 962.96]|uniref:Uncharacterized protein n=1 Tax=Dendrothele bispora (strain CBS 962.96) TaxID=1314807 RepID=A0A4S8LK59_DENBC|nr:hypothetical protein K435DRAFT_301085 [Dendrothele bispora CBS 962.96]